MKIKLFSLFLLIAANLFAHDLYIRATPFVSDSPVSVKFSMFLAAFFPGELQVWRTAKTKQIELIGPDSQKTIDHRSSSDPEISLPQNGTYVFGWISTPSYISIEPAHFHEYLVAEGYQNVIQMRKEAGQTNQGGREKYTRYLKTYVQVGKKLTENFERPFGYKIEIIPMANPYGAQVGNKLSFRFLFDGKPLSDHAVMATSDNHKTKKELYAQSATTDSDGIATFTIDKPGVWIVRTNHMLPLEKDPQANWESFWANCTFGVK